MSPKTSASVASFQNGLRAFETGGFTYNDLIAQLNRLLATGASPADLLAILKRHQLLEPMPGYAHIAVLGMLNDAMARAAQDEVAPDVNGEPAAGPAKTDGAERQTAEQLQALTERVRALDGQLAQYRADQEALTRAYQHVKESEAAAVKRAEALANDLAAARAARDAADQKLRNSEQLAAQRFTAAQEEKQRSDDALREARRTQAEQHAVHLAQLAKLQQERSQAMGALDAHATSGSQLEASLLAARDAEAAATARAATLAADLAGARAALKAAESKLRDIGQTTAQHTASSDEVRLHSEQALREAERQRNEARALHQSQLAGLQHELAKARGALDSRASSGSQMQADLHAARARHDAIAAELKTTKEAAALFKGLFERSESKLTNAKAELSALHGDSGELPRETASRPTEAAVAAIDMRADRDPLLSQVAGLQSRLDALKVSSLQPARIAEMDFSQTPDDFVWEYIPPPKPPVLRKGPGWAAIGVGAVAILVLIIAGVRYLRSAPTPAPVAAAPVVAAAAQPGTTLRDCATCPGLTILPAGRFKQGSARTGASVDAAEKPLHWVVIKSPFAMSTTDVTVDEFQAFVAATSRDLQGCDTYDGAWTHRAERSWKDPGFAQTGTHPVTCVSWNDATAYVRWLSQTTGHTYRLPTASEWEYAARAGGDALQPWGADGTRACASANVADKTAAKQYPGWTTFPCDDGFVNTAPVGSFKANAFGLGDLLGNVFQWTEDCWHKDYVGASIDGSARVEDHCTERELRGGSWFSTPAYVRANYRNHFAADYRTSSAGIRVVRGIEP